MPKNIGIISFLMVFGLFNCSPRIALYNETAYTNAVSLKVESLALMEKASDSCSKHINEINDLEIKIEKAHQYVQWLPRNELTVKQWEILMKPNGGLLGEFLKRWKDEAVLSKGYVSESKKMISEAFNEIIKLETGKIKSETKPSK